MPLGTTSIIESTLLLVTVEPAESIVIPVGMKPAEPIVVSHDPIGTLISIPQLPLTIEASEPVKLSALPVSIALVPIVPAISALSHDRRIIGDPHREHQTTQQSQ
jgi:hypothetical protein